MSNKDHWEKIYSTKEIDGVSWYQETPITSLNIIKALKNRSACLIANHGQVAFGENLNKAFELAQEIENICHQYINALRIGIPKILSKKEMKIVLGKFKNYKKG